MQIFPYIYEPEKSIDVFNNTSSYLSVNPDIEQRIQILGWVYHDVGQIIPQTIDNLWSGHYFPYTESWEELQVSLNLCFFGLYKQAFVSLRSSLELGMLSVYYNINDEGHNAVKEWYYSSDTSESNTPRTDKIWKILLSNKNINAFNDKFNLRNRYNELTYLHNFVHTKGVMFSNSLGIPKANFQTFEKEVLVSWVKTYEEIIIIITTLHLLKYPLSVVYYDYRKKFGIDMLSFGGLEKNKIERISSILSPEYIGEIEKIASGDPQTKIKLSKIDSLPDLTQEQLDEQILGSYKFSIEHGEGFVKWEKSLYELYNNSFKIEMKPIVKEQIEILRKWALEKGFMESKAKRLGWQI